MLTDDQDENSSLFVDVLLLLAIKPLPAVTACEESTDKLRYNTDLIYRAVTSCDVISVTLSTSSRDLGTGDCGRLENLSRICFLYETVARIATRGAGTRGVADTIWGFLSCRDGCQLDFAVQPTFCP